MAKPTPVSAGPGIYSATYSGIPVYEFQFGVDLKEHVMRRRHDDWINATHILKAAGFDKPARTRILERDVQKDTHEKIQGGYGKYQGTWIPLESARNLATRHSVFDRLKIIFDYKPVEGDASPPPAPRHASKPKAPKSKPAPPKWNSKAATASRNAAAAAQRAASLAEAPSVVEEYSNNGDTMMEDDIPDNLTVASASYMAEDDRLDMSYMSTGHRKRKREEQMQEIADQQHSLYGDELLDYFLLSRNENMSMKPEPPPNFQPNWLIDAENHTALHWAAAMGDVDVVRQLKRFSANIGAKNIRGETPLMRALNFTNCFEKQSFPAIMKELFETIDIRDALGNTVIHHATIMKNGRLFNPTCSRYYLENILNALQETLDPSAFQALLDAQDVEGNTALHLAAKRSARKCIRSLLGRNASADIANSEGVRAEDLIMEINAMKKGSRALQRSSSPFAPDSQRHTSFRDVFTEKRSKPAPTFSSVAATTVLSRITPMITEKFEDLAKNYDEEWQQMDVAEAQAQTILSNTQADLSVVRQHIAALEAQIESEESGAKIVNEANRAKHQVLQLITQQNRQHVQRAVESELAKVNGDAMQEDSYEEKLRLARQLKEMISQQKAVEAEYVDALSMVGTGETIEKYRKLLKACLMPEDGESLDLNLDSVVDMVEEQRAAHEMDGAIPDPDPMDMRM